MKRYSKLDDTSVLYAVTVTFCSVVIVLRILAAIFG
jgi:hypothetical protein